MPSPEVVSCPGCRKRYSVPPGVPPGQFQCQDCHAVVAYGGAAAGGGVPAGKSSARKHAKAAAAKRRLDRSRGDDEYDDDDRGRYGPPGRPAQNPLVYLAAFAVLGVLVGGTAFWHSKTKEREARERAEADKVRAEKKARQDAENARIAERVAAEEAELAAQAAKIAEWKKGRGPKPSSPGSPTAPSGGSGGGMSAKPRDNAVVAGDPVKYVENPPTGGNYGKTQSEILYALKEKRSTIVTDLPHLPDTPSDVQSKIDADVKAIADPGSGGAAIKAEEELVKIGRAAIPRVLGITANLDFSKYKTMAEARDACVVASSVDRILREITGYTTPPRLQFTPEGRIDEYPVCIDEWYTWWLTTGYKRANFYKSSAPVKPEDERL
jgi:hypothetical protein